MFLQQDAQQLLLQLLRSLLESLEKGQLNTDQVITALGYIRKREVLGTLMTYLGQLSLMIDPSMIRGRLVAQVN